MSPAETGGKPDPWRRKMNLLSQRRGFRLQEGVPGLVQGESQENLKRKRSLVVLIIDLEAGHRMGDQHQGPGIEANLTLEPQEIVSNV